MDLAKYDGKHVRVTDKWGETFTCMAEYGNHDFLECEYGGEEDGIFIEGCLIYHSQMSAAPGAVLVVLAATLLTRE